jgi:hypothetical protein
VLVIATAAAVALLVVVLLTSPDGGHGPGQHGLPGDEPGPGRHPPTAETPA